MNKTWNRSHEVATATVGIAVATSWLERPGAFLTVGSRPQLSAVATSWLFFPSANTCFLSWTLSLGDSWKQLCCVGKARLKPGLQRIAVTSRRELSGNASPGVSFNWFGLRCIRFLAKSNRLTVTFDATRLAGNAVGGFVRIGTGRDAADVTFNDDPR